MEVHKGAQRPLVMIIILLLVVGSSAPFTDLCHTYHTMGVLPSTQPAATLGSSFILSNFDLACTCCVPYVEATVFGVDMNVGCDDVPYHTFTGLCGNHTMGVLPSTQPTIPWVGCATVDATCGKKKTGSECGWLGYVRLGTTF